MIEGSGWFEYGVSAMVVGIPALGGLVAIFAGVRSWRRARRLVRVGQRVTAVVTDNQLVSRSEGRVGFLPVVLFRTLDGRTVTTVLEDARRHRSHLVETEFDVLYDPADPRHAATADSRGVGGLATIVVGLVFLALGTAAYAMISHS